MSKTITALVILWAILVLSYAIYQDNTHLGCVVCPREEINARREAQAAHQRGAPASD